ncbi:MAG TPA: DUF4350 domain-containing protein [Terriglobales bacterium]|jgi:hypothetical protein|nr:DUF4350 domain-containing protein [Terriglobales bacterium]
MPGALSRSDTKILIVAGAVLVLLMAAAVLLSPPEEDMTPFPSSYATGSNGGKAAYLLLQELGYSVARWEASLDKLPSPTEADTVLVLAEPIEGATSQDRQALESWLQKGGTVLATGHAATYFLPQHAAELEYETEWKKFQAGTPSNLSRGIPQITMKPESYWDTKKAAVPVIFGDEDHAVVVCYSYGKGRVIWWAGSTPLTNAGLKEAGNMELLLNSVGASQNKEILWDEYFHGERPGLLSYFAATPLVWGFAQLGIGLLAIFFTYSRRSGPVRPLATEPRLSPLEFVDSLGGLYQRAHAASAAVGVAHQRFRYLLIKRLGLASNLSTKELTIAVREQLGWKEPGFVETMYRCERAALDPELSEDEAVQLVQALQQYTRVLRLSSRTQKEKP